MGFRRRTQEQQPEPQSQKQASAAANVRGGSRSSGGSKDKKSSPYIQIGSIMESKDGNVFLALKLEGEYAVKIFVEDKNGELRQVEKVYSNDPAEKFDRMVEAGTMTRKEADQKINSIPQSVLSEIQVKLEE